MATIERTRLTYDVGNAQSPTDPFGRTRLVVETDGDARLDHDLHDRHRAWTGIVEPGAVERLWAALDRAGFPDVARQPVPPDSAIRVLEAGEGQERRVAYVAWHAAAGLAGYDEAFALLDAIVADMSEGSVPPGPATRVPLVRAVARVA